MTGVVTAYREGGGKQRREGICGGRTPRGGQGPGCRPRVETGENDAGYDGRRRHAAQGTELATKAGRGWLWETSRWAAFRAWEGGGERV